MEFYFVSLSLYIRVDLYILACNATAYGFSLYPLGLMVGMMGFSAAMVTLINLDFSCCVGLCWAYSQMFLTNFLNEF
jgi:hypothetical protein